MSADGEHKQAFSAPRRALDFSEGECGLRTGRGRSLLLAQASELAKDSSNGSQQVRVVPILSIAPCLAIFAGGRRLRSEQGRLAVHPELVGQGIASDPNLRHEGAGRAWDVLWDVSQRRTQIQLHLMCLASTVK